MHWCEAITFRSVKYTQTNFPYFQFYNRKYSYELHFSSRLEVIVKIHKKKDGVKCEQSFVDVVVVVVVLKNFYGKKRKSPDCIVLCFMF